MRIPGGRPKPRGGTRFPFIAPDGSAHLDKKREPEDVLAEAVEAVEDAEKGIERDPDADWPQDAVLRILDYADHRSFGIVGWRETATSGRVYRITVEDTGERVEEDGG